VPEDSHVDSFSNTKSLLSIFGRDDAQEAVICISDLDLFQIIDAGHLESKALGMTHYILYSIAD
jgi:hypothetical protein